MHRTELQIQKYITNKLYVRMHRIDDDTYIHTLYKYSPYNSTFQYIKTYNEKERCCLSGINADFDITSPPPCAVNECICSSRCGSVVWYTLKILTRTYSTYSTHTRTHLPHVACTQRSNTINVQYRKRVLCWACDAYGLNARSIAGLYMWGNTQQWQWESSRQ